MSNWLASPRTSASCSRTSLPAVLCGSVMSRCMEGCVWLQGGRFTECVCIPRPMTSVYKKWRGGEAVWLARLVCNVVSRNGVTYVHHITYIYIYIWVAISTVAFRLLCRRRPFVSSSAFVPERLSNLILLIHSLPLLFSNPTTSVTPILFSLCLSPSCSILPSSFVEAVTMNSWLVTVLLLASAANSSGGQYSGGGRGGKGRVYQLVCIRFPSQVHKCPSQATYVHNLKYQA